MNTSTYSGIQSCGFNVNEEIIIFWQCLVFNNPCFVWPNNKSSVRGRNLGRHCVCVERVWYEVAIYVCGSWRDQVDVANMMQSARLVRPVRMRSEICRICGMERSVHGPCVDVPFCV